MKNIHSHRHVLSAQENVESGQLRKAEVLAAEIEEGNNEYKFKLTNLSEDQFIHRITQLNWRLNEGGDEAVYEIGVEDDGNPLGLSSEDLEESLSNLKRMADTVGCYMTVQQFLKGEVGITAKVLLRRTERLLVTPVQVQVAVAGPADTGKSTLIAVLSSGNGLDNGKGLARTQVFRHNHEVKSGRTSSNTQHNLYFGASGNVLNSDVEGSSTGSGKGCSNRLRSRSDMELADETCRTISFIDLAGSSKYLKTTLHGIVGHSPDHFILVISARKGMEQMTSEFLGLCFALQLNLIIVLTKIDTVSTTATSNIIDGLVKMLKRTGTDTVSERRAVPIQSSDQLVNLILESTQRVRDAVGLPPTIVPIFTVSSVSGEGLSLLRSHLFQLPNHTRSWTEARAQLTQVRIIGMILLIIRVDDICCSVSHYYDTFTGSFEKRDEKAISAESCGNDRTPFSKSRCGSGKDESCFWTSDNNDIMSPAEKRSAKFGDDNSTGLTNLKKNMMDKGGGNCLDNCSRSDSTSIASLWTATSSSPSPPPAVNSSGLDIIRRQYAASSIVSTADSNRRKLEYQEASDEDLAILMGHETRDNTFCSNDAVKGGSPVHTPSKSSPNNIASVAASTFMGPDTVLFGQVLSGVMTQGDRLVLGPLGTEGVFSSCSIQSVRVNDVPVRSAVAGQTATMVLKQEYLENSPTKSDDLTFVTGTSKEGLDRSASVSMNSLSSGLTMSTLDTPDSSDSVRISSSVSHVKSSPGQGQGTSATSSLSAGSGLVLLSPNFKPVAHWEFEVSDTHKLIQIF
jgi:GTPase